MKRRRIFEILRVLRALEVEQPTYLQGSKASKVLKGLFSKQPKANFCQAAHNALCPADVPRERALGRRSVP